MADWDLIRYFLAVARTGSTLTAARKLGQSQPTVARKIAALEEAVGSVLVERRQTGYRLSEQGRALLACAEEVERAALAFWSEAEAGGRTLEGRIRFTTIDLFGSHGLSEMLTAFRQRCSDIQVEVVVSNKVLDLAAGEADVALRGKPTAGPFVGRKVAEFGWTAYCSRVYAEASGAPAAPDALADHPLIGGDGPLAAVPAMQWLEQQAPEGAIRYRSNSMPNLVASICAGMGVGMLPIPFAARHPELIACFPAPPELKSEGWLLTHERLKDQPHIRAFTDFVAAYLAERRRAVQRK